MPMVEALSCVHIVPEADALQDSTDDNTQGAFSPPDCSRGIHLQQGH